MADEKKQAEGDEYAGANQERDGLTEDPTETSGGTSGGGEAGDSSAIGAGPSGGAETDTAGDESDSSATGAGPSGGAV